MAAAELCSHVGESDPVSAIRRCVDSLLLDAEVGEPPVNLDVLASWRRVREVQHIDIAEAGRLVPEDAAYVIQVNRRHTEGKRRFTIGHEICHTFFDEATASAKQIVDAATGLFDIRQEEEYLCDIGAAHILLNPRWLIPMARSRTASLNSLLDIAGECGASVEATAFQLAQAGIWPCTFVFWEPGFRKAERLPPEQRAFEGWERLAGPTEKLRARRVYGPEGMPFVPKNKSVGPDTQIFRAYAEQTRTEGEERFDIGGGPIRAYCQSEHAPYHDETGALRPRVVSCIVWERASSVAESAARQMTTI